MGSNYRLEESPSYLRRHESRGNFERNTKGTDIEGTERNRMEIMRKVKFTPMKKYMISRPRPPYATGLPADYAVSKAITDFGSVPDSLMQYHHPLTHNVAGRRRLMDNDKKLGEMRVVYATKRIELDEQWQLLHHDEIELKKSFMRFNQFVRENLEKRERAAKKFADDVILREKRTAEVEALKFEVRKIKTCMKNLDNIIRMDRIFEDYLGSVARLGAERGLFKTIDDILNKYETIISARNKLVAVQRSMLEELEYIRHQLKKVKIDLQLTILGLTNRRSSLLQRFKHIFAIANEKELLVEKIKNSSGAVSFEIAATKLSIKNLYISMCLRKDVIPDETVLDDESLLLYIKRSFEETMKARKLLKANIISKPSLL